MPAYFAERAMASRRRILVTAAAGGFAAVAETLLARAALATPAQAAALLAQLGKGKPREGRVNLTAPAIAENGNTVPLTIDVESPMTPKDYVKVVRIVADGNPNPGVATFHFSPVNGRAQVQLRCRLAQSEKLIVVAEMSDGSLWTTARAVKVTIGGCGG
ncbi:MAG TPA: thiosulfate oxidation carrier protein SoxY [Candidatus Sulfotelmatobacter sp.]|nr:thiosulfate oxidation carrier protein SoxY [Candidatus Sulfotelmatobacter sp.]